MSASPCWPLPAPASLAPQHALVAQAAKPTVAIMYFNNNVITKDARDYDGLSKGLPDFLITEMSANSAIRVVERDQVQKLIDEQKLVGAGQVDRESAVKVGKLLGAQHMIFGGFMADPKGNFRIDARAVNVETGAIEFTDRVQDRSDNVLVLIGQLASRLNSGLKLPSSSTRTGDASTPAWRAAGRCARADEAADARRGALRQGARHGGQGRQGPRRRAVRRRVEGVPRLHAGPQRACPRCSP